MRGLRSGMDKVFLVSPNEEMAKSVSGKVEWLASHGSLLRLDAISLGFSPDQKEPSVITPSQKRVPEGEKIRKEDMQEREEKFDKFNRPQGHKRGQESRAEEIQREIRLDEHSRPRDQKVLEKED